MSKTRIILEGDRGDGLSFRLPSDTHWFIVGFLSVWLLGWSAGWLFGVTTLLQGGGGLFVLVWLAGWSFGGFFAVQVVLWQVFGYERLTVSETEITITRATPIWRKRHRYDALAATNLRATTVPLKHKREQLEIGYFAKRKDGTIKFDNGGHTIGFGLELETEEAREIVSLILHRYPQLAPRAEHAEGAA